MQEHFLKRGYPLDKLEEARTKVALLERSSLITPKSPPAQSNGSEEPRITLNVITKYHPTSHDFREIIDKNWEVLGSPGTQSLFEAKVIFGHKRPKNIREHLVRAALKPTKPVLDAEAQAKAIRAKSCGSPGRCNYCPKLDTSGVIKDNSDGRGFQTRTGITCRSNNLIYAIECNKCGMHYVGQTKRRLMDRMVNHFTTIWGEQGKYPVGQHFSTMAWMMSDYVLEFCQTLPTDDFRQACEAIERKWQFRLHSNFPLGMNHDNILPTGTPCTAPLP